MRIYTTCPQIALVALGRALTRHSARSVTFMEWNADEAASGSPDGYRACEIF